MFSFLKNTKQSQTGPKPSVFQNQSNSTQSWFPIKDIHNNLIYRKDGYIVAAISVSPVNLHLLTENEQAKYIRSFEEVLNGIDESFQILSLARPVDLDAYIAKLNVIKMETDHPIKQRLLTGYMNHAAQTAISGEAMERQFYILIDQPPTKKSQVDEATLLRRAKEWETNLTGAGLSAKVCDDAELRDLVFIFTNPNQAAYERAPDTSIQFPTIYRRDE